MEKILVDEIGYEQFFDELNKLKILFSNNASDGSQAYNDAVGDGWHDNFAFEEAMRKGRNIATRIDKMLAEQHKLKKVEKQNVSENVINIDDIVKIRITYDVNDIEEYLLKLTGKYLPDSNADIQEISLNCPIGKSIYLRHINDDLWCEVNNKKVKIRILEIIRKQ